MKKHAYALLLLVCGTYLVVQPALITASIVAEWRERGRPGRGDEFRAPDRDGPGAVAFCGVFVPPIARRSHVFAFTHAAQSRRLALGLLAVRLNPAVDQHDRLVDHIRLHTVLRRNDLHQTVYPFDVWRPVSQCPRRR